MKYWVFDLDGTIVDSFYAYFDFLEKHLQEPLTLNLKKEYISRHPKVILKSKLNDQQAEVAMQELIDRNKLETATMPLFSGVKDALEQLHLQKRKISIWTSRDYETTRVILDYAGLQNKVDHVVAGDQVSKRKPDPEGLLKIQNLYNCCASELVMIGDHEHDIVAAKSIGAQAIRASWHPHWEHELCSLADKQFFCHQDFTNWVSKI